MRITSLLCLFLLADFANAADDPKKLPPNAAEVRQTVERSLAFLEKDGVGWMKQHKCTSCHAVPMAIWSMNEAEKAGFKINVEARDDLRSKALKEYTGHAKFKPVGQDGGGDGLSRNVIYLSFAASINPTEDVSKSLDQLAGHLIATQEADGSWKSGEKQPPVNDVVDVTTMQVLLALSERELTGPAKDAWPKARDRALAWLKKTKPNDSNQAMILRVLTSQRFGLPEETKVFVKQLVEQQREDGGWAQLKDRASDAFATGQTLYVLNIAGVKGDDSAVQRAWTFLVSTQRKDGSWEVKTRNPGQKGFAISYTGSGWATIGLMRTLPKE